MDLASINSTTATISAIVAGILAILAVLIPGIISIINALRKNTEITVAAQEVGATRGKIRDKKIQEIHVVTNSRLTAALKLIVFLTKKEYERTNSLEDKKTYDAALEELDFAERATAKIDRSTDPNDSQDETDVRNAEAKLATLTASIH